MRDDAQPWRRTWSRPVLVAALVAVVIGTTVGAHAWFDTHAEIDRTAAGVRDTRSDLTAARTDLAGAIADLEPYFEAIENAPAQIRNGVPDPAFSDEAGVWLDASFYWGQALRQALRVLEAGAEGNSSDVATSRDEIQHLVAKAEELRDVRLPHSETYPRIGDGVVDTFIQEAGAQVS